jgi:hypothetical protein
MTNSIASSDLLCHDRLLAIRIGESEDLSTFRWRIWNFGVQYRGFPLISSSLMAFVSLIPLIPITLHRILSQAQYDKITDPAPAIIVRVHRHGAVAFP